MSCTAVGGLFLLVSLQQAEEAFKVTPYDKLPPGVFQKNDPRSAQQAAVAALAQPAAWRVRDRNLPLRPSR